VFRTFSAGAADATWTVLHRHTASRIFILVFAAEAVGQVQFVIHEGLLLQNLLRLQSLWCWPTATPAAPLPEWQQPPGYA